MHMCIKFLQTERKQTTAWKSVYVKFKLKKKKKDILLEYKNKNENKNVNNVNKIASLSQLMSHFFRPKRWDTDYVLLFIIIFLRWAYRQTPAAQVFQQSQDAFHRGLHIWSVSSCFICPFYHTTLVRPKVLTAVNLFFQHVDCFFYHFPLIIFFLSSTTRDITFNGYFIPKDTCVFINQYQVNHDTWVAESSKNLLCLVLFIF